LSRKTGAGNQTAKGKEWEYPRFHIHLTPQTGSVFGGFVKNSIIPNRLIFKGKRGFGRGTLSKVGDEVTSL
jgi:hypothetical protein